MLFCARCLDGLIAQGVIDLREHAPESIPPYPPYEQGLRPIPAPPEPEEEEDDEDDNGDEEEGLREIKEVMRRVIFGPPKEASEQPKTPFRPVEQNTEPVQIVHVHPVEVKHVIERVRPEQPAAPVLSALPNPVQDAPKPATKPVEKSPGFIAQRIADHARPRNKIDEGDAIKPATKNDAPVPARRQQKPLPVLKGKAGRVHSDEMVDDIMRTMLRDGKAPYGRARQQYNYRFHSRLADLADELIREGVPLHATFRNKGFWREWSGKTGKPLHASFYRKFA